jgi:hypothetical protein
VTGEQETEIVIQWIGLAGVVAGALIAFVGQYLLRRTESQERNDTFLLEQLALIIALSEDYRNRVWEERKKVTSDVVNAWDLPAYRLAEARLRVLCRDQALKNALQALHDAGTALGHAWRLTPNDEEAVQRAWEAHRKAIECFVNASSQVSSRRTVLSRRRAPLDVDVAR